MYPTVLRFCYDHEDPSTMRLHCSTYTMRFFILYPDSYWPRSCFACIEYVQDKHGEGIELPDHEDSTTFIL